MENSTRGLESLRQFGTGAEPSFRRVNHRFFQFYKDVCPRQSCRSSSAADIVLQIVSFFFFIFAELSKSSNREMSGKGISAMPSMLRSEGKATPLRSCSFLISLRKKINEENYLLIETRDRKQENKRTFLESI